VEKLPGGRLNPHVAGVNQENIHRHISGRERVNRTSNAEPRRKRKKESPGGNGKTKGLIIPLPEGDGWGGVTSGNAKVAVTLLVASLP